VICGTPVTADRAPTPENTRATFLSAVLGIAGAGRTGAMVKVVQDHQGTLQGCLTEPLPDPVSDFVEAGLPLVLGVGKQGGLPWPGLLETAHADTQQANAQADASAAARRT
jgi:hypothetical protein